MEILRFHHEACRFLSHPECDKQDFKELEAGLYRKSGFGDMIQKGESQMRHRILWAVAALIILGLQLSACALAPASSVDSGSSEGVGQQARIEPIKGTNLNRVILTAGATKRLDIQTTQVRDIQIGGIQREAVPYSAIMYDLHGQVWVYTNPAPLTFVRASVAVDYIDGGQAILLQGPPSGTTVVTVGVPELFGTEFEGGLEPS